MAQQDAPPAVPSPPGQETAPIALVRGAPWVTCPKDLYIPPDALEVFLDAFEGPLDLLLYLIKRQNLDILDIPIVQITTQYMAYVDLMQGLRLELAAEYLVMAAMLAEIKSRMLLPRPADAETDEGDPRAELIRRLQEYERFKEAAQDLDALPRLERDHFLCQAALPNLKLHHPPPPVDLQEVLFALREVIRRADLFNHHRIEKESLSLRERMANVLAALSIDRFTPFIELFLFSEGRMGVVVTFMAILELIKAGLIELIQTEVYGPLHVKAKGGGESP